MGKKIFLMFAFIASSISFVCAQSLNNYIGTYAGTIDLQVEIDGEGNLTTNANDAGTLDFEFGGSSPLMIDDTKGGFQGTIDSNKNMVFTLHVRGKMIGIPVFPASVTFVSKSFVAGN